MSSMNNFLSLVTMFGLLISCATPVRSPGSESSAYIDYPVIFKSVRNLMIDNSLEATSKTDKKAVNLLKKIPESFVIAHLQENPNLLFKSREELLAEIEAEAPLFHDPTKPLRLLPPSGRTGYSELKLFVNHPYYRGQELIAQSDLVEVWKKFILSAQKEIILNVFDFDLEEIALALIHKAREGVQVTVGIDKKSVIDVRPEVKKIYDELIAGGVHVTGVQPVGLNHQKITAIDWSDVDHARVLFSSGNLTRSCLEPEGDLKGTVPLPKESAPNANHLITMRSWILGNLVHHELTKTLDANFLLRGRQYPLSGTFQVTGPGVEADTMEIYPENSITIAFTPGGGFKSVNKHIIADVLRREKGPIRMMQFAYSAAAVDEALLRRAEQDIQESGDFDFLSVGDTPFAMREWSRFLKMSGYKRIQHKDGRKQYLFDSENPWVQRLGDKIEMIKGKVFVAPRIYGNNWVRVNGKNVKVNAKIHHKIMSTSQFAIVGTSFNFSEGAESNNEQILVIRDPSLVEAVDGMVRYMIEKSPGTVAQEAARRNSSGDFDEGGDDSEDISGENVH